MTDGLKVPPNSIQAEQSVLGALLLDNSAFDRAADLVGEADFYRHEHRLIWSAVAGLVMASKPADVVTVYQVLQDRGQAEDTGGLAYLNDLAQSVPSAANIRRYAEIIREKAQRRRLLVLAYQLQGEALESDERAPLEGVIDRAATELMAMLQGRAQGEPVPVDQAVVAFLDDLQARADGKVKAFGTGLRDLDRCTAGGGRPGELWVIGARPSMGKTAMVLQLCRWVGRQHHVLLLTQEDSLLSATARMVAAEGGANLAHLRDPARMPDATWAKITDGVDRLNEVRLHIDDQPALSMQDVRRKALQVARKSQSRRLDLLVIDYLQLMTTGAGENRSQQLGVICNGLKNMAKELGIWVVLLSQLTREADKVNGPPSMQHLRESGDIEGAADTILLLYREFMRTRKDEVKHWGQIKMEKQKNGPVDLLNMGFDGELQRWYDWDGPAPKFGRAAA